QAVAVGEVEQFEGPPLQWGGGGGHGECGHVVGGLNLVGADGGQVGEHGGEAVHRGVLGGAFTRGLGQGVSGALCGCDGGGAFGGGGGFVVVDEQDWGQRGFHVPADVVGQHAQKHVGADPVGQPVT